MTQGGGTQNSLFMSFLVCINVGLIPSQHFAVPYFHDMTGMQDARDHALIYASPYVVICRDLLGAKYIPLDTLTIFFVWLIKRE